MPEIKDQVGIKSRNDPFDVAVVQKLLTAANAKLQATAKATNAPQLVIVDPGSTDGHIDDATKEAIKAFQTGVMKLKKADGRIRPGGQTWSKLLKEAGAIDTNPTGYPKRPDNVNQLGANGRDALFSTFIIKDEKDANYPGYKDNPGVGPKEKDNIKILGKWESRNIQAVEIPQLKALGLPHKKSFHKLAIPQLLGLWQAWEDDGLLDRIVSFDGAWNPRYMRKALHIEKNLSNHCWGTAFDINAATNHLGTTPAVSWEPGCVFELVPLAVRWGFFWGGWFGGARDDGMHFEVRVITSEPLPV